MTGIYGQAWEVCSSLKYKWFFVVFFFSCHYLKLITETELQFNACSPFQAVKAAWGPQWAVFRYQIYGLAAGSTASAGFSAKCFCPREKK